MATKSSDFSPIVEATADTDTGVQGSVNVNPYEDSPFGKYSNPVEQAKYDEWASKSDEDMDGEWNRYLSAR